MELITLQNNPKQNDIPHGRKRSFGLNVLSINSGTSCTIYLRTLVTGTTIEFSKHCKTEFGAYAEAHKKTFPRNSTQSCTERAICLGPTGNLQGSYCFLNLHIWRRIKRSTFTPLPVPTHVIICVHALANDDDQNPALDLFDRLVNPILYGNTPNNDNEENSKYLAVVE